MCSDRLLSSCISEHFEVKVPGIEEASCYMQSTCSPSDPWPPPLRRAIFSFVTPELLPLIQSPHSLNAIHNFIKLLSSPLLVILFFPARLYLLLQMSVHKKAKDHHYKQLPFCLGRKKNGALQQPFVNGLLQISVSLGCCISLIRDSGHIRWLESLPSPSLPPLHFDKAAKITLLG